MALIEQQGYARERDRESAKDWTVGLKDDEIQDIPTCAKHGRMNWWKGPCGEQNWFCVECEKEK